MLNNRQYNIIFTITDTDKLTFYKLFDYQEYSYPIKIVSENDISLIRGYSISKELKTTRTDIITDKLSINDLSFIFNSNFNGSYQDFKLEIIKLISDYNDEIKSNHNKRSRILMVIKKNRRIDLYRVINNSEESPAVIVLFEKHFNKIKNLLSLSQRYCHNQSVYELSSLPEFKLLITNSIFEDNIDDASNRLKVEFLSNNHGVGILKWKDYLKHLFIRNN